VRLEIAPCLLTRYQRVGRNLAIERELFGCCRHPIQYREVVLMTSLHSNSSFS